MKADWNLVLTLVLAIVLATLANRWVTKQQAQVVVLTNTEPSTIAEYVAKYHPNAR